MSSARPAPAVPKTKHQLPSATLSVAFLQRFDQEPTPHLKFSHKCKEESFLILEKFLILSHFFDGSFPIKSPSTFLLM
jgi:hypothetical protein